MLARSVDPKPFLLIRLKRNKAKTSDQLSKELEEAIRDSVEDLEKRFSALIIMVSEEKGIADLHKYNRLIAVQVFERGRTIYVE